MGLLKQQRICGLADSNIDPYRRDPDSIPKGQNTWGVFHNLAFMGVTITNTFQPYRPADEFSFKETMTWGPFKISSGWLCVWCESKEIEGETGAKIPSTNGGELSADFLPTMKSY